VEIIPYPHPTLRHVSKPIRRVDQELINIIRSMFDAMYEARGIGLAANQVDLPLRFFLVNLEAERGKGDELVFINPVVSHPKGSDESEEGCLSLPGLYGDVVRPKSIRVNAYSLEGKEVTIDATGMLARVIQHELDHLNGVLFIDKLSEAKQASFRDALDEFEVDFNSRRATGSVPSDEELTARRAEWENRYCR